MKSVPRKLLNEFHSTCHEGLEQWLLRARGCDRDLLKTRLRMMNEYPALAVASAHHYTLGPAYGLFWAGRPLREVEKYSRLRIGPDVPASKLRIKTGRGGWPRLALAKEEANECLLKSS